MFNKHLKDCVIWAWLVLGGWRLSWVLMRAWVLRSLSFRNSYRKLSNVIGLLGASVSITSLVLYSYDSENLGPTRNPCPVMLNICGKEEVS